MAGLPLAVGLVTAVLAPNYADTYATPADLARAEALMHASTTSAFLYGRLPTGADTTQLAVWELGALTCLLLGILVVLRTVARTRLTEDLGLGETLRGLGVTGGVEVMAAACVSLCQCLGLGVAAGCGLMALDGVTADDALAYGGAVGGTCAILAALALLLAQLADDAPTARGMCLAALAVLFTGAGLHAARGWHWAGAWSPFALREAIDPGGADDPAALVVVAGVVTAAVVLAGLAARRRDLGAGLVHLPARHQRPLRVRGPISLAARLCRRQVVIWALATTSIAGILTAMGGSVVDLARQGAVDGGSLGAVVAGEDPGRGFLAYIGVLAGAMACAQALLVVGRFSTQERAGLVESQRATGTGPVHLLGAAWTVAAGACSLSLAVTCGVVAVVGGAVLDTGVADAVELVAGQWPAALAAAGIAALLAGVAPRATSLGWGALLASLGLAQLGATLGLPQGVIDAGPLAQAGQRGSLWLVVVAGAGIAVGLAWIGRRDLAVLASSRQRRPHAQRSAATSRHRRNRHSGSAPTVPIPAKKK